MSKRPVPTAEKASVLNWIELSLVRLYLHSEDRKMNGGEG